MRILFVASEAVPFVKTGGLADVAGALPLALARLGHDLTLAIPGYRGTGDKGGEPFRPVEGVPTFELFGQRAHLAETVLGDHRGRVRVLAVFCDAFYDRDHPYTGPDGRSYRDNLERFAFFQRAVLHWASAQRRKFDVIHCHDHQAALIPPILWETTWGYRLGYPRTVMTIHNIAYQGVYPEYGPPEAPDPVPGMSGDTLWHATGLPGGLLNQPLSPIEFYGRLNSLKAGVAYADAVTTVSPTYAKEITESDAMAFGLAGHLRHHRGKLTGILNGIDSDVWSPATDAQLPVRYTSRDLAGKQQAKRWMFEDSGFSTRRLSAPLFGLISRLVPQKGLDLVAAIAEPLVRMNAYLVILGSGMPEIEQSLREVERRNRLRVRVKLGYDDAFAHRLTAASDLYLMPSRHEPCGLNQLYSMAYGTLPVVRRTGGLADSVRDLTQDPERGTGFQFTPFDADAFLGACARGVVAYRDPRQWQATQSRVMLQDFSWTRAAGQYEDLYRQVMSAR